MPLPLHPFDCGLAFRWSLRFMAMGMVIAMLVGNVAVQALASASSCPC